MKDYSHRIYTINIASPFPQWLAIGAAVQISILSVYWPQIFNWIFAKLFAQWGFKHNSYNHTSSRHRRN
jgi:hypothetical protein